MKQNKVLAQDLYRCWTQTYVLRDIASETDDLKEKSKLGRLRSDLEYWLKEFGVEVPEL